MKKYIKCAKCDKLTDKIVYVMDGFNDDEGADLEKELKECDRIGCCKKCTRKCSACDMYWKEMDIYRCKYCKKLLCHFHLIICMFCDNFTCAKCRDKHKETETICENCKNPYSLFYNEDGWWEMSICFNCYKGPDKDKFYKKYLEQPSYPRNE